MKHIDRFTLLVLLVVSFAAVRSLVATRFDGFTIDEPYHIVSGVSYVERGDFRLNPEHPPLVKLWVGAWLAPSIQLPRFRALEGKIDERDYHESTVFLRHDPDNLRRRARLAMIAFHMLAFAAFAFAARRVAGAPVALGALLFLAIDPTVAAHMPVVMTDLPVAILSAIAILTAIAAFRTWRGIDVIVASLALGLALGTKHNAIITAAVIAAIGIVMAIRAKRVVYFAAMLLGAILVLWSLYGFRYYETSPRVETFNKPIAEKISDLRTPAARTLIDVMNDAKLLPRAYLWGLADIVRAGVESRAIPFASFGRTYIGDTPWHYFPAALAVKVPLGLLALTLAGFALAFASRQRWELAAVALLGIAFLAALMISNSGYAGVRHALPLFPVFAVFAGVTIAYAWQTSTRVIVIALIAAACIAALPVARPWEFFNAIAGGTKRAHLAFSDEGLDLGQRTLELERFYRAHVVPSKLPAYDEYGVLDRERERRKLQLHSWSEPITTSSLNGWFFIKAGDLATDTPWADFTAFRRAKPVARFGNLLVYRGTFELPWIRSFHSFMGAVMMIHGPKPDPARIEALFRDAVRLNPRAYPMQISLGNFVAQQGRRDEALRAFLAARGSLAKGDPLGPILDAHIARIRREPPQRVAMLTNPWSE
ncbi:MAG TPA: hypothetical protein VKB93_10945 [Thermoanaerobaculia bacterium]|nr:hypothetical protein [Thermoanaerobaculia bacterium]